jgi:thiosulfate/3-mercaptopyruvate sulfurtransferase
MENNYHTLISAAELFTHLEQADWVIADCRFSLSDTEKGWREYQLGHIPGAAYCHLEEDLSGPVIPGKTGRHPLPAIDTAIERLSRLGIAPGIQVVAYDDWPTAPGAVAARLWWTLHWLGHTSVAVLDGGLAAWIQAGLPLRPGVENQAYRAFFAAPRPEIIANTSEVEHMRLNPAELVLDARSADRYRGENETIDPLAGHIPGALSAPYGDNVGSDGHFLSPEQLKQRYLDLLGTIPASSTAFYCGSGVTAALNILALAHAGLGEARLYPGSWSEWVADRTHPIALGSERF